MHSAFAVVLPLGIACQAHALLVVLYRCKDPLTYDLCRNVMLFCRLLMSSDRLPAMLWMQASMELKSMVLM